MSGASLKEPVNSMSIDQAIEHINNAFTMLEPMMPDAEFEKLRVARDVLQHQAMQADDAEVQCNIHRVSHEIALQNLGAANAKLEVSLTDQRSFTKQLYREQLTARDMTLRLAFAEGFIASQPEAHATYLKSRGQNLMTSPSLGNSENWGIR